MFDDIHFVHTAKNSSEGIRTQWNMLNVISALIHYRNQEKSLPESLVSLRLCNRYLVDGWGQPLIYQVKDQKWFLKSKGPDGTDEQIDFDHLNDPKTWGKAWENLCCDGQSALHWELYHCQKYFLFINHEIHEKPRKI
jgi:hypothetical protein